MLFEIIVFVTSSIIGLWLAVELLDRPHLLPPVVVALAVAASLGVDLAVSVGSVRVAALDGLIAVVLLSAVIGVTIGRLRLDRPTWPWLVLLGLFVLGLGRGIATFGLQPATNAARLVGGFLVPAVFIALQRRRLPRIAESMVWSWCAGAVVLSISAVLFLARNGLTSYSTEGTRALDSLGALIVAQAGLVAVARRTWPVSIRAAAGTAAIVILAAAQVRTVAVAVVAGICVLVLTSTGRSRVRMLTGAGMVLVVLVVVAGSLSGLSQSLRYASTEPFQQNSTFEWRTRGWAELLDSQIRDSGTNLTLGDPAGSGTTRRIRLDDQIREVVYSAHSQWVTMFLSTGLVGAVVWTGLVLWIGWRSARRRRPELSGWYASGATAIVFSITYQLGPDQGLVLGLLAGFAALGATPLAPSSRGADDADGVPVATSLMSDAR